MASSVYTYLIAAMECEKAGQDAPALQHYRSALLLASTADELVMAADGAFRTLDFEMLRRTNDLSEPIELARIIFDNYYAASENVRDLIDAEKLALVRKLVMRDANPPASSQPRSRQLGDIDGGEPTPPKAGGSVGKIRLGDGVAGVVSAFVGLGCLVLALFGVVLALRALDSTFSPKSVGSESRQDGRMPITVPDTFNWTFSGTLEGDIRIKMTLRKSGTSVSGTVSYLKYGIPIPVRGSFTDSTSFWLDEFDQNNVRVGRYSGRFITPSQIQGTWAKPNGSKKRTLNLVIADK